MPRKKLMNDAIRSEADFRKVLVAICVDLGEALGIVNRYSVTFFRTSNLPKIIGADDYLRVLRTLQDHVEAHEARFQDDIRRARELTTYAAAAD